MRKLIAAAVIAAFSALGLASAASASTAHPAYVANETGPYYLQINSHRDVGLQTHGAGEATLTSSPTKLDIEQTVLAGTPVYRFHANYDNDQCLYANTSNHNVALAKCERTHLGQYWVHFEVAAGVFRFINYITWHHAIQYLSSIGDEENSLVVVWPSAKGAYREWHIAPANSSISQEHLTAWPHQPSSAPLAAHLTSACRGGILGQANPPHTNWRWGIWWTTNPNSPPCWARASMECENTLNGDKAWYHAGGWVKSVELLDGVTCPLLAKVLQAGVDYGHNPGSPYTYEKIWPASHASTSGLTRQRMRLAA